MKLTCDHVGMCPVLDGTSYRLPGTCPWIDVDLYYTTSGNVTPECEYTCWFIDRPKFKQSTRNNESNM